MKFTREINRLLFGMLLVFTIVAVSATYWAIVGPNTLLNREDNPRRVEAEAAILRGSIYDRHDTLLVESKPAEDRVMRTYLHPEANSALGYFSLRYGVGGAEAAYNTLLRGDDLPDDFGRYFHQTILHRRQVGSDVRLTLDIDLQTRIVQAMKDRTGAVVVMSIPDGAILALASLPTFDPNTLNENWDSLIADPGKPFFNRVFQGSYQPGGMLQTPLMAAAILYKVPFDEIYENGTAPLSLDDLTLQCALRPAFSALTLPQAYAFGCPAPFAALIELLGREAIDETFSSFYLNQQISVPGFVAQPLPAPEATPDATSDNTLLKQALGQGSLTVSPMNMAMTAAAIINGGNAPQPYALLAVRRPGETGWTSNPELRRSLAFMTAETADQLRVFMRQAVEEGAAYAAAQNNLEVGGHAALAYSGEGTQSWFIGFMTLNGGRGVVVAVVLENSADLDQAVEIGSIALSAGSAALTSD